MPSSATLCGNCSKALQKPLVCARCKTATYCSKDCQTKAWKAGHKRECVAAEQNRNGQKHARPEKAPGFWCIYTDDVGMVPKGTPGMCFPDVMKFSHPFMNCVLVFPNHYGKRGKLDGNVWALGELRKCKVLDGDPSSWPGGPELMEATEKLLDGIFHRGQHVSMLRGLGSILDHRTTIVDGPPVEGAWSNAPHP